MILSAFPKPRVGRGQIVRKAAVMGLYLHQRSSRPRPPLQRRQCTEGRPCSADQLPSQIVSWKLHSKQ
jgi:hypothetical protein